MISTLLLTAIRSCYFHSSGARERKPIPVHLYVHRQFLRTFAKWSSFDVWCVFLPFSYLYIQDWQLIKPQVIWPIANFSYCLVALYKISCKPSILTTSSQPILIPIYSYVHSSSFPPHHQLYSHRAATKQSVPTEKRAATISIKSGRECAKYSPVCYSPVCRCCLPVHGSGYRTLQLYKLYNFSESTRLGRRPLRHPSDEGHHSLIYFTILLLLYAHTNPFLSPLFSCQELFLSSSWSWTISRKSSRLLILLR